MSLLRFSRDSMKLNCSMFFVLSEYFFSLIYIFFLYQQYKMQKWIKSYRYTQITWKKKLNISIYHNVSHYLCSFPFHLSYHRTDSCKRRFFTASSKLFVISVIPWTWRGANANSISTKDSPIDRNYNAMKHFRVFSADCTIARDFSSLVAFDAFLTGKEFRRYRIRKFITFYSPPLF